MPRTSTHFATDVPRLTRIVEVRSAAHDPVVHAEKLIMSVSWVGGLDSLGTVTLVTDTGEVINLQPSDEVTVERGWERLEAESAARELLRRTV